jgi:hypothetical protein
MIFVKHTGKVEMICMGKTGNAKIRLRETPKGILEIM